MLYNFLEENDILYKNQFFIFWAFWTKNVSNLDKMLIYTYITLISISMVVNDH